MLTLKNMNHVIKLPRSGSTFFVPIRSKQTSSSKRQKDKKVTLEIVIIIVDKQQNTNKLRILVNAGNLHVLLHLISGATNDRQSGHISPSSARRDQQGQKQNKIYKFILAKEKTIYFSHFDSIISQGRTVMMF